MSYDKKKKTFPMQLIKMLNFFLSPINKKICNMISNIINKASECFIFVYNIEFIADVFLRFWGPFQFAPQQL